MTSGVVVFELRVAVYVLEDDDVSLSLGQGVSLEGRDKPGREKSFKAVL